MDTCDQAPLGLPKMQNHELLMLDWRSFSGWGREPLSTCLLYKGCQYIRKWQCSTIANVLQLTVGYLNATINRKTQNAEPEIGHDRSSHTQRNPWVEGYGARFGPPRSSGLGVWTVLEPTRTVFPVPTRTADSSPGPVANTRGRLKPMQIEYNQTHLNQMHWKITPYIYQPLLLAEWSTENLNESMCPSIWLNWM